MMIEVLRFLESIFFQPLTYLFILGLLLLGLQRVRRERRSFGLKVYGTFNEVWYAIGPSLLIGLIGSILMMGIGVALPTGIVILLTLSYIITMLSLQFRYLSPLLAVGLAMILTYFFPYFHLGGHSGWLGSWIHDIQSKWLWDLGVFLAIGALMEGVLLYVWGWRHSSPRLINSKRGKCVGAHEASHMWILPFLFLLPVSGHLQRMGWWPLAQGTSFSIVLFPIGVGVQQLITYALPKKAIRLSGLWVIVTGVILAILVAVSYFYLSTPLLLSAAIFGILSRLGLVLCHYYLLDNSPFHFTDVSNGLRVVGVIPGTPAATMDVKIGEVIVSVNGKAVTSEQEFYEALHLNLAYCKIDVIDEEGEIRFVKGMTHENDLHQIGFLFLEPSKRTKAFDGLA
ncbi:PDZ domain-containing protein [Pullulanibacillus sp. KACC 23026]|uniref:PDZ domain-containing protein n=1 Tax=Pullulanibacillus sp. KACC 23026 TaxID=3028315 RepID=UPI0023B1FB26|nr:PDZ domain-containing protein [Pullulanibacillus sp. KACC 23026]WEG13605.1 PDZ domain-containing protein [Pullulanibacillus sp. KACC 23026]